LLAKFWFDYVIAPFFLAKTSNGIRVDPRLKAEDLHKASVNACMCVCVFVCVCMFVCVRVHMNEFVVVRNSFEAR
jgi:hypothetical protein